MCSPVNKVWVGQTKGCDAVEMMRHSSDPPRHPHAHHFDTGRHSSSIHLVVVREARHIVKGPIPSGASYVLHNVKQLI